MTKANKQKPRRRNSGTTRRQYELHTGPANDVMVAGPSDGHERLPDMTEREAEGIRDEARLYPRCVFVTIKRTVDMHERTRGFVVLMRRDDGMQLMCGSKLQWPEIRKSLLASNLILP